MAVSSSVNSPLNMAVGQAVRRLREMHRITIEDCARRLGPVSGPYLRAIEGGSATLPPDAVHGLVWDFGANFTKVSGLLALLHFLDVRVKGSLPRSSDLLGIKARIAQVLAAEKSRTTKGDPQLDDPLKTLLETTSKAIEEYIASGDDIDEPDYQRLIKELTDVVWTQFFLPNHQNVLRSPVGITDDDNRSPFSRYDLSPVFEDLLETLATRLELFPPHITFDRMLKWEEKNTERIQKIFSYHSSPEYLIKTAAKYSWAFLWNRHAPLVRIYISHTRNQKYATEIEQNLHKVLKKLQPRHIKDAYKRVTVRPVSENSKDSFRAGLVFDFASREMPKANDTYQVRQVAIAKQQYREFKNVWLYHLQADTFDSGDRPRWIGFLDDFQDDLTTIYAVVLSNSHSSYWQDQFSKENATTTKR